EAAMILAVRLILGSVFAGNLSTLMYSTAGAVCCLAGMIIMRKIIPEKNLYLASAAGAVFHNTGQILAACLIMRSSAVFFYYPFLIVSGIIAGLFTGFCAMFVLKRLSRS
ncbi:MAG: Gx transporter family protein, partial [Oscillospiraceae bacterium]|nr:Gx transporter family protein [Oscillospiraceae bacterium]